MTHSSSKCDKERLSMFKMGDGHMTLHSCLSHGFHRAHVFHFHQIFGEEVM